jgi:hypothetical protein
VVAAGNRIEDRALVRTISSALINRVVLVEIRADVDEWLAWASRYGIRAEIFACIQENPAALLRPIPSAPEPFSTPRAWASLSSAMDLAERAGVLDDATMESLAYGRLSPDDANSACNTWKAARAFGDRFSFNRLRDVLNKNITDLELPVLVVNSLKLEGIHTIRDLAQMTEYQLFALRHFDRARVQEVQAALSRYGLHLEMSFH